MQRLEVSGVVRLIYRSLGVKGLRTVVSYEASQLCSNTTTGKTKYFNSSSAPPPPPPLALQLLTARRRIKIKHEMRFDFQ